MKLSAAAAAFAATWASLLPIACGIPTISFPVNAQLPPVARISQQFSFIFAENTFTSSSSMTYSLDDPPDWLSVDSSQRWLHGTPEDADVSKGDIVGVPIVLVATDDDGSTSLNVTLVVARTTAPTVKIPIGQQLADSGHSYSEPSSLLSYPASTFNLSLSPNTFSSTGLNYYAVSGDNSPLPSWVSFDAGSLTFSGTTPPADSLVEPPQTFDLQLVASDVTGFSAASVAFSIVVGSHTITVDDPSVVLNATVGTALNYTGLQTGVKIDGRTAGSKNLSATVLSGQSLPDWLSFDNSTWLLSGTPPTSAQNTAFSISFADALADTVNVTFQVDLDENGTVFRGMLPALQAERGEQFSVNLTEYLEQKGGINVTVETVPNTDWVHYDNSSLTISGTVPINETASSISVSVRAMHELTHATESETFMLQIVTGTNSTGGGTPASTTSASASSTAAAGAHKSTSTRTILLAVLIPTLSLAFIVAIVACCMCYRRVRQKQRQQVLHLKANGISHPVPLSFAYNGQENEVSSMRALNKVYKIGNRKDAISKPPRIEIMVTSPKLDEDSDRDQVPAGTALTVDNEVPVASRTTESLRVVDANTPMTGSPLGTIPDFPSPPLQAAAMHHSPTGSVDSAAGSSHEQEDVGVPASADRSQWPFAACTEPSVHSLEKSERNSGPDHSMGDESVGDALGIYSINSGDGTNGLSSLGPDNSIPSQRAIVEEYGGSVGSQTGASLAVPVAAAVAATVAATTTATTSASSDSLEMAGAAGGDGGNDEKSATHENQANNSHVTVSDRAGSRASIVADADGSWATLYTISNDNIDGPHHGYAQSAADVERGMAGRSTTGLGSVLPDGGEQAAQTGFLSGFAARIASRFRPFKKRQPQPTVDQQLEAASAAEAAGAVDVTRGGIPASDVSSFDTDLGSVRIDSATTAQPYRPKPVFISRDSRISEEPSQLSTRSSRSTHHSAGDGRPITQLTDSRTPKELRLQAYHEGGAGEGDDLSSDANSSADEDENREGDRAIRMDPPQPVLFIQPSRAERDARSLHSSLSYEIASSLGSRHRSRQKLQQQFQQMQQQQKQQQQQPWQEERPESAISRLSGISAAIEEVRSLLLLPDSGSAGASAASLDNRHDQQQQRSRGTAPAAGAHLVGQPSTSSSRSWETLETQSSNEPNWRSLCTFVLPPAELNAPPRPPMGRVPYPLQTQAQAAAAQAAAAATAQAAQAAQPTPPAQATQSPNSAQSTQSGHSSPYSRGIEHPVHASFKFPMRPAPSETQTNQSVATASEDRSEEDVYQDAYEYDEYDEEDEEDDEDDEYDDEEGEDLILSERYRPASSYYADAFEDHQGTVMSHSTGGNSTANTNPVYDEQHYEEHGEATFPAPFIVDSSDSDGSVHHGEDSGGGSGSRGVGVGVATGNRPSSIGLAVSKYSQPQLLGTQASLVSTVSSGGVKVFI